MKFVVACCNKFDQIFDQLHILRYYGTRMYLRAVFAAQINVCMKAMLLQVNCMELALNVHLVY